MIKEEKKRTITTFQTLVHRTSLSMADLFWNKNYHMIIWIEQCCLMVTFTISLASLFSTDRTSTCLRQKAPQGQDIVLQGTLPAPLSKSCALRKIANDSIAVCSFRVHHTLIPRTHHRHHLWSHRGHHASRDKRYSPFREGIRETPNPCPTQLSPHPPLTPATRTKQKDVLHVHSKIPHTVHIRENYYDDS